VTKRFYYGGQAVIEGVMMRGQKNMVTVVRRPDGELAVDTQPLSAIYTGWMRKAPLLRGVIILIEALVLGMKTLLYSANVSLEEESDEVSGGLVWVMVAVALVLAVALFFVVPLLLTRLFNLESSLLFNLVDGAIRVVIFITYLKVMTLLPDIKRVFAYHGAEHKTVYCYEAKLPLTIKNVKKYSTLHPRCGTSFLAWVIIVSIICYMFIPQDFGFWIGLLFRILILPIIAGLSYELLKLTVKGGII